MNCYVIELSVPRGGSTFKVSIKLACLSPGYPGGAAVWRGLGLLPPYTVPAVGVPRRCKLQWLLQLLSEMHKNDGNTAA